MRLPVETVGLTEEIFQALKKVFDSKNPYESHTISDGANREVFEEWKDANLGKEFWGQFFEIAKSKINSVMLVDFPEEQVTEYPDPIVVFIEACDIIGFKGDNQLEYLMYEGEDEEEVTYYYVDAERYAKYDENGNLLSERLHDLGYCPARFMWTTPLTNEHLYLKQNPITNYLGMLDKLLFRYLAKDFIDTYSSFPIMWSYEADCDFEDEKYECRSGYLFSLDTSYPAYVPDGTGLKIQPCPLCDKKKASVFGADISVPIPMKEDPIQVPPVGIIEPSIGSLEYNTKEVKALEERIYNGACGSSFEVMNREAVNKDQVSGLFEDRKEVLMDFKPNFENAMEWLYTTCGKAILGANVYQGCTVNLGTSWYLLPDDYIKNQYLETVTNEVGKIFADDLFNEYVETKYRNNPDQILKQKIIKALDPALHAKEVEVNQLLRAGVISQKEYALKMNFWSLITRFEMENGPLEAFGTLLDFRVRINRIKETLLNYINISNE